MFFRWSLSLFLCSTFLLLGCSKGFKNSSSTVSRGVSPEEPACITNYPITTPVTLTGTAQFQARQVTTSGLLGPGTNQPIRFAEVQVVDVAGATVQCGATDATGALVATDLTSPLRIPRIAGSYRVKVNSRATNTKINVSVLSNPYDNFYYTVAETISVADSDTTKAVTIPVASYTGTLEGGAFNLLDQIYLANEYLRNNSSCPTTEAGCAVFTVAPKIKTFWAPGVDPGTTYLGLTYAISAFLPSSDDNFKGLYILGGKNGDSDCFDTDHFDNSVILHEYGHFLESAYSKSDSPGGSHNGNAVIDPRLAWSEGWANFFQAAVSGSPYYQDTNKNSACSSGTSLQVNLALFEKTNYQDVPTVANEGIYREASISRSLWQATSAPSGLGRGASIGFNYVWRAFTSSSFGGVGVASNRFRNAGIFNKAFYDLVNANDPTKITATSPAGYDNVLSYELQPRDILSYATPVSVQSSCTYTLTGGQTFDASRLTGTALTSSVTPSLYLNNKFLSYNWSGSGTFKVKLKYQKVTATAPDLDLYVYKESHTLLDTSTMVGASAIAYASEPLEGSDHVESVTASNLAAGTYLIQVNIDDSVAYNTLSATFTLTDNAGAQICP
jgi:hypothetical protein